MPSQSPVVPEPQIGEIRLSPQELRILSLFAAGLPLHAVARRTDLSSRTVRRRTRGVCDRLGAGTLIEAVAWAARRGLL
jgi:DNA-binding NarL/FixJ family response regulator